MKTMLRNFAILTTIAILLSGCENIEKKGSNLDYVDPYIGGIGHLLHPTRPNVQLPNQVIRMHPLRADFLDDQISFFPLTIASHRNGELFGILPGKGDPEKGTWSERQTYDHDLEIVKPYYFYTYLIDEEIGVEFVPGKKVGYYQFRFPAGFDKRLKLNIINQGIWTDVSGNVVTGEEDFEGMKAFVYGEFNQKGVATPRVQTVINKRRNTSRQESQLWYQFPKEGNDLVEFKYAISYISANQAKDNFNKEFQSVDFASLKNQGMQIWDKTLGQIQVKGGTEAKRRSFYTALYRNYERMVDISEYGKYYSAYDHQVHESTRPFYIDDWVWDTYLAMHPLRMILNPKLESDMLQSYVTMYEQGGWMPQFPLLFKDNPAMHGFHSTIVFLDAYRKNIRDFDIPKAYEGIRKNATDATMLPWRNGPRTSLDTFYRANGYFPALHPGETEKISAVHSFEKRQSVAITLAHSYDDWALSEMAKDLGKTDDYNYFHQQAANYRNLYRPDKKLMWPKDDKGNWIEIDPKFDGGPGGRDYYDENNAYTYQWHAQHDIRGLINLMGGRENFIANLDQLFREDLGRSKSEFWSKFPDATGLVGQFSMGNEPSFPIPYLYNFAGEPWKTQKKIRFLLDAWFEDNIFGIPGDEDGGGMTSFVVFSSMGFYPVTPGLPVYTLGSPVFEEVKINLDNGKTFTLKANHSSKINKYIKSAKINGKALNRPWFTHDDLVNGATIELEMGSHPNKQWGSAPEDAPPSGL